MSTSTYVSCWIVEHRVSEPGYLAGAGAVTLARLRLQIEYLFNNSRKLQIRSQLSKIQKLFSLLPGAGSG